MKLIKFNRSRDPEVIKAKSLFPYKIIDIDNEPHIQVKHKGANHTYTPEEITAMIIKKLKENVENFLGVEVKHAVITFPTYFDSTQRFSMKLAAQIAGLRVVRVMQEPIAATLAYGLGNNEYDNEKNILVINMGNS